LSVREIAITVEEFMPLTGRFAVVGRYPRG
jgi:hypothetical protein